MQKPFVVKGPAPTVEELAKLGGISKSRLKEIQEIAARAWASEQQAQKTRAKAVATRSNARSK